MLKHGKAALFHHFEAFLTLATHTWLEKVVLGVPLLGTFHLDVTAILEPLPHVQTLLSYNYTHNL